MEEQSWYFRPQGMSKDGLMAVSPPAPMALLHPIPPGSRCVFWIAQFPKLVPWTPNATLLALGPFFLTLHENRQNRTPHNTRVPRYTRGPMLGTSWNQQRSGHRHPQSAPKHLKALRAEGWQQSRKSSTLVMQSKPVPRHMSRQGQGGAHALPPGTTRVRELYDGNAHARRNMTSNAKEREYRRYT